MSSFPVHLLLVACLLAVMPARAAIYKIIDEQGRATYTDRLPRGVKPALVIRDVKASPAPGQNADKKPAKARRTESPMHFPKVDSATQSRRDDARRDLLRDELNTEQRELASAKSALTAARNPTEQRQLAESVGLHEKNIEMINKELARIR